MTILTAKTIKEALKKVAEDPNERLVLDPERIWRTPDAKKFFEVKPGEEAKVTIIGSTADAFLYMPPRPRTRNHIPACTCSTCRAPDASEVKPSADGGYVPANAAQARRAEAARRLGGGPIVRAQRRAQRHGTTSQIRNMIDGLRKRPVG